jgi:hypothetical protein
LKRFARDPVGALKVASVFTKRFKRAKQMKKLILLELNEINFDVVKKYIASGATLPGFKRLIDEGLITTTCESSYSLLEPWIQWPSVHMGLSYEEHKLFRLGDVVNSEIPQIFEEVESLGYSVGAISPMNAENRLQNAAYFIPDPWTQTRPDKSFTSRVLSGALSQAINDNSQSRLTLRSVMSLLFSFIVLVSPRAYPRLVTLAVRARGKSWLKAIFLDSFLFEVHKTLFRRSRANFSTLFLNAGAHIQHHYFLNSKVIDVQEHANPHWYASDSIDPLNEMLTYYDSIILGLLQEDAELVVATGLSQKPYEKEQFYYRLIHHNDFLKAAGVPFDDVHPRMTRDFVVSFGSREHALQGEKLLSSILVNNKARLFGEIDNRGADLFVVLTYPDEIVADDVINDISLSPLVSFVAIKNGEHQDKGYLYLSAGLRKDGPKNLDHVSNIHDVVLRFFSSEPPAVIKVPS